MHDKDGSDEAGEFLLLDEIARMCRAPVSTVRYWVSTGRLRSIRPGRRRLVRRVDLDRFLTSADSADPIS